MPPSAVLTQAQAKRSGNGREHCSRRMGAELGAAEKAIGIALHFLRATETLTHVFVDFSLILTYVRK